ncbi:hypothetical protein [Kineosporia sp. NBRC 101731]|uniref:hypothetical protein n=1 Tax=Kineosporia sp. NBRC 101731 TaxID=3032199 RepID=UPI0024A12575|nr:hypothetical protein [Kineosporia sp. NBRC 101731]GLY32065.1 hypothetical protein Kisp02_54300 [Kineosporia sp. NBRC 101731]
MSTPTLALLPDLIGRDEWTRQCKAERGLRTSSKLICLLLADCWDEKRDPEAPITIPMGELGKQGSLSRAAVYRSIREIVDLGYIAQMSAPRQHRAPTWRPLVPEQAAAVAAELKRRRDASPGVVYYLLIGDYIKVGYTADLNNRLNSYPPDTQVLHSHPGTLDDEADTHVSLRPHLAARREWYLASPELLAAIEEMKA